MSRALVAALALSACLSCDSSSERSRTPPPDGIPWLALRYQVDVTLLSSTCSPGGLTAEAVPATAEVFQSGTEVEWAQRGDAPDAETWFLVGRVCAADTGGVMRLVGGRRDAVDGCQVITDVPPFGEQDVIDDCDPAGQATLEVDECGRVTGEIEAGLRYARDCAFRSPCRLRLRLEARPTARDPRAPEPPEACRARRP